MAPNPEEVLKLAAAIVRAKQDLADLELAWEAMFTSLTNNAPVARAVRDGSFSSRVETVIFANPEKSFTIAEVAQALGEANKVKVGRTLFRLYNTKRIANPGRGLYSAKRELEAAA